MEFPSPVVRGRLVQRYKRFLADVVLDDGTALTAHVPNPGAMLGLNTPGLACWLSQSPDPRRKLAHALELVEVEGPHPGERVTCGVNTVLSQATGRPTLTGMPTDGLQAAPFDVKMERCRESSTGMRSEA